MTADLIAERREHRLVLDVGKTNVKLHVLNRQQATLSSHTRDNVVLEQDPYPHADVEGAWVWLLEACGREAQRFDIGAISVTTHGATAALVGPSPSDDDLMLPVLDYEWQGLNASDAYDAIRPPFFETLSPALPAGLNLGRQLHWLERTFPDAFQAAESILLYPQYWVFRLSGCRVSEVTSLGCHTDLWYPAKGDYSSLVDSRGWRSLFPPIVPAWDAPGPISPAVAAATGLPEDCRVHAGVHDSNASFLRFLLARPDDPFTLVSTGTWVVCMASGGSVAALTEARDMLANVDVNGRQVPCCRFMGGREYAEICRQSGATVGEPATVEGVETVIADEVFALPDFSSGSGPFGGAPPTIEGRVANGNALATLYCALMVDVCLDLLDVTGDVIVAGSYLKNPLLCSLIAALRARQDVYLSSDSAGTLRGAAQLTDWERPAAVSLTRAKTTRVAGLTRYRERWRALAEARR